AAADDHPRGEAGAGSAGGEEAARSVERRKRSRGRKRLGRPGPPSCQGIEAQRHSGHQRLDMSMIRAEPPPRTDGPLKRLRESNPIGYLFTLPYAIFFAVFVAYPLGFAIYLTFHNWNIVRPERRSEERRVGKECRARWAW